jgi:hypothetical protein
MINRALLLFSLLIFLAGCGSREIRLFKKCMAGNPEACVDSCIEGENELTSCSKACQQGNSFACEEADRISKNFAARESCEEGDDADACERACNDNSRAACRKMCELDPSRPACEERVGAQAAAERCAKQCDIESCEIACDSGYHPGSCEQMAIIKSGRARLCPQGGTTSSSGRVRVREVEYLTDASPDRLCEVDGVTVETVFRKGIGDSAVATISSGRLLIVADPDAVAQTPQPAKRFLYLHECGHHYLRQMHDGNVDVQEEQDADCFAVNSLIASGEISYSGLSRLIGQVPNYFSRVPNYTHLGSEERAQNLKICLEKARLAP